MLPKNDYDTICVCLKKRIDRKVLNTVHEFITNKNILISNFDIQLFQKRCLLKHSPKEFLNSKAYC